LATIHAANFRDLSQVPVMDALIRQGAFHAVVVWQFNRARAVWIWGQRSWPV
jgi:hypothetical protein